MVESAFGWIDRRFEGDPFTIRSPSFHTTVQSFTHLASAPRKVHAMFKKLVFVVVCALAGGCAAPDEIAS